MKKEERLLNNSLQECPQKQMMDTILKIKNCIEDFSTVIDIGASNGQWTDMILKIYPNVTSLMIEANPLHEESLKSFIKKHQNTMYELCAAGDTNGSVYFDNSDLFGGLASHEKFESINGIEVPVSRCDDLVKKHNLQGKYLLKMDTHGFEVPILEGSREILKECTLVVIETYNFKIAKESLKFWQMCEYMDDLGFSPIGLSDLKYRKYDNALWQFDLVFIPKSSKVFEYNEYQ